MAKLYKSTGEVLEVSPDKGKTFSLARLQELVGGYIEILPFGNWLFVCDEEGKLKGKPLNANATEEARRWFDPFVGDVLYCKRTEIK